jgi:hypothetical protein
MKILVACESSGIVRDSFKAKGHDVWSCDLLPSESPGNHIQEDVIPKLKYSWDMIIAHPPCTYLASSGARWFHTSTARERQQNEAIAFFNAFLLADCPRVAIENPIGIMSTKYRKPDQIIQPWMFGHGETKATCLWLKGLPKLKPTDIVPGREARIHKMSPSPTRGKDRSRTYQGIADAMANQWGDPRQQAGEP